MKHPARVAPVSTVAGGRAPAWLLAVAFILVTTGCAVPPVRYYSLAGSLPEASATPVASAGPEGRGNRAPVHIEVAPVGVPERLARPQMLIRNASGSEKDEVGAQVDVLEQQRWASSLDTELRDAFAGAISFRAGAVDVTRGGRLPDQPVYRIAIRVGHLDMVLDRQVDAVYGWTITRSEDSRHGLCEVAVSRPAGRGMEALVEAVKQTVAVAAEQIAAQIAQLEAGGTAACESGANAGARTTTGGASGRPGQGGVGPGSRAAAVPGAVIGSSPGSIPGAVTGTVPAATPGVVIPRAAPVSASNVRKRTGGRAAVKRTATTSRGARAAR